MRIQEYKTKVFKKGASYDKAFKKGVIHDSQVINSKHISFRLTCIIIESETAYPCFSDLGFRIIRNEKKKY